MRAPFSAARRITGPRMNSYILVYFSLGRDDHWLRDISATRFLQRNGQNERTRRWLIPWTIGNTQLLLHHNATATLLSNREQLWAWSIACLSHSHETHYYYYYSLNYSQPIQFIVIVIFSCAREAYGGVVRQQENENKKRRFDSIWCFCAGFVCVAWMFQHVKTVSANACENNTQNTFAEWQ